LTPKRNKQIEIGVKKDCPTAKKLLTNAFSKLPNNEQLIRAVLESVDLDDVFAQQRAQ
jgi:hypothetical protein